MHWRLGYRRYLNLDQTKLANWPDKGKKDDRGRIYSSKIYNFRGCRNIAAFQLFKAFPDKVRGRRIHLKMVNADNFSLMVPADFKKNIY